MTITPPPTVLLWLRRRERQQVAATAVSMLAAVIEAIRMAIAWPAALPLTGLIVAVAGALIALRARWIGLMITLAGTAITVSGRWDPLVEFSIVVFTLFGITVRGLPPVRGVVVSAGTLAVVFGVTSLVQGVDRWADALAAIAGVVAGGAAGAAVRLQRQYWESLEQRAQDALARGEIEAERRAAAERLRIARDLHDIIGHNVAVISMHLGAVEVSAGRDPVVLERSLGAARTAVQAVLSETQQTLDLLRDDADQEALRPVPSIAAIPDLVASFEQIGLRIDRSIDAGPADLVDPASGLIAYRVLQEALTNAHRYGEGDASVTVLVTGGDVTVDVQNRIGDGGPGGSGYGLLGMRERVAAVGGSLQVDEHDGVFRVSALIPADGGHR